MPVEQLQCVKDSHLVASIYGSGADPHCVATTDEAGYAVESLVQFEALPTGIVTLTYARHYRKIVSGGGYHDNVDVGATSYADRITQSWSEGNKGSNHSYQPTNGVVYPGPTTSTAERSESGAQPASGWWYQDVTDIVQKWVDGSSDYGFKITSTGGANQDLIWASRHDPDTAERHYLEISYSTNTAPNAPTGLTPTGDTTVHTLTPTFAGTFSDDDTGDTLSGIQIKLYADNGTTLIWDSGTVVASSTAFSKVYSGTALTGGTYYKWQGRTKDAAGDWGAYSALQRFRVNSIPNTPTLALSESPTTALRTLTPTFLMTHNDPDASDTKVNKYRIILETSAGAAVWDSGDVTVGVPAATVSKLYDGSALSWQTAYRWRARTQDAYGAWSSYSSNATFTTATTSVPISLAPSGVTVASLTPTLTGSRGDANDSLASAQVEVYDSAGTTLIWDSGTFTTGVTSSSISKVYAGSVLAFSTTYKWRVKATGATGGASAWSSLQSFTTPAAGDIDVTAPVGSPVVSLTPNIDFSRTASFNAYQIEVVRVSDSTVMWDTGTVTHASATSKSIVYAGTALAWNIEYKWRVRVSSDSGSTWGSGYTGYTNFTTDAAGSPTLTSPSSGEWITSTAPTFTGSTAGAESATAVRILVYASDQTTLVWDSTDVAQAASASFSIAYGGTALTKGSVYYWQARYTKSTGPTGPYSTLQMFHVNADPSAPTGLSPATGAVVADGLTPTLKATYADSDKTTWGDYPTLQEFEVRLNSDGTLVQALSNASGLTSGENEIVYSGAVLSYDVDYKMRARYTDSKSAAGAWSSYAVFKLSQSPTVVIDAPLDAGTVTSPAFSASWTMTSPGSKAQYQYRLKLIKTSNDTVAYDSGLVVSSTESASVPAGYLQNSYEYRIELTVYDTDLLVAEDSVTITADWTSPDPVTGLSATVDEDTSVVTLVWNEASYTDFNRFQIYRKEEDGEWEPYDTVLVESAIEYKDYYAGQGKTYRYKMTWLKSITGDDDLESLDSEEATAPVESDKWIVIGSDLSADHTFELPVEDEQHTNPVQREIFEPVGSRRKVAVRGYALGAEGRLTLVWADDEREDGKEHLTFMRETAGPHILKSPFGDVWLVDFDGDDGKHGSGGLYKASVAWTEVA